MDDKQKSRKYFDGHSSTFVNRNGYWNYDYRLTSRILKKRNVKKLVDIGCGNGAFLELFHKLSPGTKLAGLDLSHEMVLRSRVSLAKETGINILLPYYPLVFEGSTLTDVYEMLYELYKKTLRKYRPENICFMGGFSGGNLAIGMASYINDRGEGLPMPGKIYAGSPGTLLLTEEEKRRAGELEKTDVIMSVKATENIWEGMTGGEKVPEYMKYLQLGNYYGLSDVYMSFGGDEVFLAGADSIRRRLEKFGTHVTVEIGEGMYHSYAMMPLVEDAQEGYRHFVEYIKE